MDVVEEKVDPVAPDGPAPDVIEDREAERVIRADAPGEVVGFSDGKCATSAGGCMRVLVDGVSFSEGWRTIGWICKVLFLGAGDARGRMRDCSALGMGPATESCERSGSFRGLEENVEGVEKDVAGSSSGWHGGGIMWRLHVMVRIHS